LSEEDAAAFEFAALTDVGRVRQANEDHCDDFERADRLRLLVVADGMGGHRGGATASLTAVETIGEIFSASTESPEGMLRTAIESANERIHTRSTEDPDLRGMGTTVVALCIDPSRPEKVWIGHVGDSRIYRCRRGRLSALTTDHSVVAEMQLRGLISADEAAVHPRRNEILRSVGVVPEVEIDIEQVDAAPGDRFMLCSDGLSGVLRDEEIAAIIQGETPEAAVATLVRAANERGGPDNITVQILAIPGAAIVDQGTTAPVEVPAAGTEMIEGGRRARRRSHQIAAATVLLIGIVTLGYLFHLATRIGETPATSNPAPPTDTRALPDGPTGDTEAPAIRGGLRRPSAPGNDASPR